VTPCDVDQIIKHTQEGTVLEKLWRGTMAPLSEKEKKDLSW